MFKIGAAVAFSSSFLWLELLSTGRERVSFEFWDSAERQNRRVPWPVEAPSTEKPDWTLT
jgi:hypothetical protein